MISRSLQYTNYEVCVVRFITLHSEIRCLHLKVYPSTIFLSEGPKPNKT